MNLKIGNRYELPHGYGKLIGRETFTDDDKVVVNRTSLNGMRGQRYVFEIEQPNTWVFKNKLYCACKHDIKTLE